LCNNVIHLTGTKSACEVAITAFSESASKTCADEEQIPALAGLLSQPDAATGLIKGVSQDSRGRLDRLTGNLAIRLDKDKEAGLETMTFSTAPGKTVNLCQEPQQKVSEKTIFGTPSLDKETRCISSAPVDKAKMQDSQEAKTVSDTPSFIANIIDRIITASCQEKETNFSGRFPLHDGPEKVCSIGEHMKSIGEPTKRQRTRTSTTKDAYEDWIEAADQGT
jgi:hypothetical protein